MKNKFFKQRSFYAVFLSVVLSVVLVAGAASAVTTISSNITTGGTLTVSSVTTLNSYVNLGDAATSGDDDRVYLYGTTTVIGPQAFVFGSSSATTLSGQAEGSVFYDSTNRILRLYSGSDWHALASSTDAAGGLILTDGTLRIQLNDWSTNYLTFGTTTAEIWDSDTSNVPYALLTLQATSTVNTPLRVLSGSTTPGTVNLFAILNGGDASELFVIDGDGNASTTSSFQIGSDSSSALNGDLYVSGTATTTGASGNFAAHGTLTIGGASTLNGNVTLGDAALDVLTLTGNATTSNSFQVGISSAVAENGDLYVSGMATTTGATGNISTLGQLTVTSTTTLSSSLFVNGTTTAPNDGGLTLTGDIHVGTAGTTTLRLISSSATRPGCIEIMAIDGSLVSIYATTTPRSNNGDEGDFGGTGIAVQTGGCE